MCNKFFGRQDPEHGLPKVLGTHKVGWGGGPLTLMPAVFVDVKHVLVTIFSTVTLFSRDIIKKSNLKKIAMISKILRASANILSTLYKST